MTAAFTALLFQWEGGMPPWGSGLGLLWQRPFPPGAHHPGQPGQALWTHHPCLCQTTASASPSHYGCGGQSHDIMCMPGLIPDVPAWSMQGSNACGMNKVMGSRFGRFMVGSE